MSGDKIKLRPWFTVRKLTLGAMKMFVRNRQSLFFTLFMPVIIMTVFGLVGLGKVAKIDIGVANDASSQNIQSFIDSLNGISAFNVHVGSQSVEQAALEKGDLAALIILPQGWVPSPDGAPMRPDQSIPIEVLMNSGQQQQSQTALSIINQIVDKTTLGLSGAPHLFAIQTQQVNSHDLTYIDFLLPGIIAIAIMQMSVFSVAFVFADYKEKGILKRLVATPMKPYQFVTANIFTRLVVAIVQAAILTAIGVFAFKAQVIGSFALVFLIALLGAVMFLGLGFTISGIARTVEAVPAIANLIVFPMLFLGGTFFPITTMPVWMQHIVKYLPLTYFADALRQVMTQGAHFLDIRSDLLWMLGWAVVLTILANVTFGFEEKQV